MVENLLFLAEFDWISPASIPFSSHRKASRLVFQHKKFWLPATPASEWLVLGRDTTRQSGLPQATDFNRQITKNLTL